MTDPSSRADALIGAQTPCGARAADAQRRFQLVFGGSLGCSPGRTIRLATLPRRSEMLDAGTLAVLEDLLTQRRVAASACDRRVRDKRSMLRIRAAQLGAIRKRERACGEISLVPYRKSRRGTAHSRCAALRTGRASPRWRRWCTTDGPAIVFSPCSHGCARGRGVAHIRAWPGVLVVVGPRSPCTPGIHDKRGGPHGREVAPPTRRHPGGLKQLAAMGTQRCAHDACVVHETSEERSTRSVGGGPSRGGSSGGGR